MGFFQGAGVLAHELGHNLGAPHDSGAAGSACDPNKKYLMAPYVAYVSPGSTNTQPWQFSQCSIQSFRNFFNELAGQNNDCTRNRGVVYNQTEYDKHTEGLAGQLYTVNQQCELLTGAGGSFCGSNENTADICRNLRCQRQGGGCGTYTAAHGTPCGNDKLCFQGLCSQQANGTFAPPTQGPTQPPTQPPTTAPPIPCNSGNFTAETGEIVSPNYPNLYPNNRECVYQINREAGERIQLSFLDFFNVEASACQYDYLEIWDGNSENSPLLATYCGTDLPQDMISTGNSMYLKFTTDESVQGNGFKISYSTISAPTPTPTPTPPGPDGYSCSDVGVGDYSCTDIRSLMGNAARTCANFFGQCCQYCYDNGGCKKDRPVKGASKYKCADLVTDLGMEQTCSMFPYFCCKTCKDFATSRR